MRKPKPYDVVASLAGHDSGKLYIVTGAAGERLFLCDGRNRKQENPKCKSPKHVRLVAESETAPATDKEIRQTLALAAEKAAAKEGKLLGER